MGVVCTCGEGVAINIYLHDCNFSNLRGQYLQLLLIRLGAVHTRPNNKMSLRKTGKQ